jgi:hypothetical protein
MVVDAKIGTNEPIFDFPCTLGKFLVNITLIQIKVESIKKGPNFPLNLGTHNKLQVVKLNVDFDLSIANVTEQLLK